MENCNIIDIFDKVQGEMKNLEPVNILVVGKSTLINSCIGKELARTGVGEPITQRVASYQSELVPLKLYDTRGLELDSKAQSKIKKEIFSEIKKGRLLKGEDKKNRCMLVLFRQYHREN